MEAGVYLISNNVNGMLVVQYTLTREEGSTSVS